MRLLLGDSQTLRPSQEVSDLVSLRVISSSVLVETGLLSPGLPGPQYLGTSPLHFHSALSKQMPVGLLFSS